MSLVRPAWLYAALMAAISGGILWFFLRPDAETVEPAPTKARVVTGFAEAKPIDLAISSSLFSLSGDPPQAPLPDPAAQSASSVAPPRLVGIAMKSRGTSVALAVDAAGATRLIRPGETIDGWTLEGLSRAGADFAKDGERQTVQLGQMPGAPATSTGLPTSAPAGAAHNMQTGTQP